MLLKSIRLQNIRSYVDELVEFPTGSVLLAGEIGSGKSSVLLAIEFALFGIQRGELSGTDLLRHGSNNGCIEMIFDLDGKKIVVCRNLKRDKKGISQETGYIEVDGNHMHKTASELRALVVEMLGYPSEYVTKNPLMFRYAVYTPQDDMKRILFADSDERLNILRKIFDVDKYGRIRDNTNNIALKELRTKKRELEVQFSDLEKRIKEKGDKEKLLTDVVSSLDSERMKMIIIDEQVKQKEGELDEASIKLKELGKVMQNIASNRTLLDQKKRRLQSIKQEIGDIDRKIASMKVFLDKEIKKPDLDERAILNSRMKLDKERQNALSNKGVLENEIKRLQQILSNGLCEFCGQNVSEPSAFKGKIDEKNAFLKHMLETISSATKEIERMEELRKMYTEYLYELRMKTEKQRDYSDSMDKRNRLNSEMQMLDSDIVRIEQEIDMQSKDIIISAELEGKERMIKNELIVIRRNRDEVSRNVARFESHIETIKRDMENLDRQIIEKQRLKEGFVRVVEISSWLDMIFLPLMESMEKHVLSTIQQEFNSFFQDWFSVLIPDENISVMVDDQFTPVIEQAGYQTEYQNLSGGEKTSVALAYRLALNKVINSLVENIKTKDIIILDEPTDGFSMDQLDRIRDVLNELALKQMIIVSHEPKIDTYVDSVIRFYKEGHVSRVVR